MKKNKLGAALNAAVEGFKESFRPAAYSAGGVKVSCPHCQNDQFDKKEVMMQGGTGLICSNCGLSLWFVKPTEQLPRENEIA